jgi:hypothetical protein
VEFDYAVAKNGFGEKGMEAFFEVNVNKENFGGLLKFIIKLIHLKIILKNLKMIRLVLQMKIFMMELYLM